MSPTATKAPEIGATNGEVDDQEFELVTSVRQLGVAPPLRTETVDLVEWKTASGKAARFLLSELTAGDWEEFLESGRIYTKEGLFKRYDNRDEDFRLLAYTIRDTHGNRLWHKVSDAKSQLSGLGRATLNLLLNAANRVNAAKVEAGEGNSEETLSDS